MEQRDLRDIQRLVIEGYKARPAAKYALLEVTEPAAARRWLGGLIRWIGSADTVRREERKRNSTLPLERRLCVAFTWAGLRKLGFPKDDAESAGFVGEFLEGMVAPHRSLILGDVDGSDPGEWRWGRRGDRIHVLLIVYSESKDTLAEDWSRVREELAGVALWESDSQAFQNPMEGYIADDEKEHFGFKDGISQPYIAGSDTNMRPSGRYAAAATVAPGEFILGHPNEMGWLPVSPRVPNEVDPGKVLPDCPEDPARCRDFGRNGSYLVLRQLEQDVKGFRDFVHERAEGREEHFAALLVGRQQDGKPLVEAPDAKNDFGFWVEDRYGLRCPVGSHIRRVNPRDSFADPGMKISPEEAQAIVNRHRLIRRGRLYGERRQDAKGERGLLFLCLNANLQRQFEFVQQHWINGPKFGGLDDEVDPIAGAQPRCGGRMTIQDRPRSRRIEGLRRFVTVRGGAYFFLPGLKALQFLAELQPETWPEPASWRRRIRRFRPSRLCPSADLQTLANQVRRAPDLARLTQSQRQMVFEMRDGTGDALLGALHEPRQYRRGQPLVVVIHGLPGSQESEVVLHTSAYFLRRGHPVLRLNQRGAGPSQGNTRGIYHAGRSDDLREVIQQLRGDFTGTGIVLVAYSLGANVMLKMLGEIHPGDHVRAAVSVSAPIDLRATATHLQGLKWLRRSIYVRVLLHGTKRCARAIPSLDARQLAAIDSARSFYEFDERFLAPFNGFASANDYYEQSSSASRLAAISVPTLLIHSQDDPMVPFAPYRAVSWDANAKLYHRFTASGGHAGFHQRERRAAWHDECAAIFFDR